MQDRRESQYEPTPDPDAGPGDVATVVVVDRREDVATICGRLDSAPTFAVVIHAPKGNRQLATEYGMRRLRRYAEETGHALAVATGNRALASRAVGAGLPVARKPANVRWDRPGRSVVTLGSLSLALPSLGQWPGIFAITVGFFLIVLAALFVLPSATVTVILAGEPVTTETEISIVEASSASDPVRGILVARPVTLHDTVLLAIRTTGVAEVATEAAVATVSVTAPAEGITVPAGAVLLAGPVRFRLDSELSLGPRGTASVTATAVLPGPSGNVVAGAVNGWEDDAFASAVVTNPTAAVNGAAETRAVVTEADLARADEQVDLLAGSSQILARLAESRSGELVIKESLSATAKARPGELSAGDAADVLVLEVDVEITGEAVPADALLALAEGLYETGSQVVLNGTVEVEQVEPAFETGGETFARVAVTATLVSAIDPGEIRGAIAGRRPGSAKENLLARYRMDDVELRLSPGWAPFVPRLGSRINVEVRATSGEEVDAPAGS